MSSRPDEGASKDETAPNWLTQLESRREKLKHTKLGHESGAGAPCNSCGDGCPGLDLHFWRKICRNCKCRKDQHECIDELTGWAQFEILGQTRSKSTYLKVLPNSEKPQQLDWVPPNVTPELASDYMKQLDPSCIPVVGSEAAAKRKQQLEFQVPPHDLDASLCHNLTGKEQEQLEQYVATIKQACVGQGNVIRIGIPMTATAGIVKGSYNPNDKYALGNNDHLKDWLIKSNIPFDGKILKDKMFVDLLESMLAEKAGVLSTGNAGTLSNKFDNTCEEIINESVLSDKNKFKVKQMKLSADAIVGAVLYGDLCDAILAKLKSDNAGEYQHASQSSLGKFRSEYLNNENFKNDIEKFISSQLMQPPDNFKTPKSKKANEFYSPLPVNTAFRHGQLLYQDTPMRKYQTNNQEAAIRNAVSSLGIPLSHTIYKDKIIASLVNSEIVNAAIYNPGTILPQTVLSFGNVDSVVADFEGSTLSPHTKEVLEKLRVNSQIVQSCVQHRPFYDKILEKLQSQQVRIPTDTILDSVKGLLNHLDADNEFRNEIEKYVESLGNEPIDKIPFNNLLATTNSLKPSELFANYEHDLISDSEGNSYLPPAFVNASKSIDSGISSMPLTPNNVTSLPEIGSMSLDEYQNVNNNSPSEWQSNATQAAATVVTECKNCKLGICSGEVAVKAERGGEEVYHPKCFVCHTCNELLADLVYFYHDGKIYCARDLAVVLKIPRCKACDELIFTKEYTAAEGETFHIRHFCCNQCDLPLAGLQYVPDEKTNMPLCLKCFDEHCAERCRQCEKIIGPEEQGVAFENLHWHGVCFLCTGCKKSLLGGRFCIKQNMPFCSAICVRKMLN